MLYNCLSVLVFWAFLQEGIAWWCYRSSSSVSWPCFLIIFLIKNVSYILKLCVSSPIYCMNLTQYSTRFCSNISLLHMCSGNVFGAVIFSAVSLLSKPCLPGDLLIFFSGNSRAIRTTGFDNQTSSAEKHWWNSSLKWFEFITALSFISNISGRNEKFQSYAETFTVFFFCQW